MTWGTFKNLNFQATFPDQIHQNLYLWDPDSNIYICVCVCVCVYIYFKFFRQFSFQLRVISIGQGQWFSNESPQSHQNEGCDLIGSNRGRGFCSANKLQAIVSAAGL